LSLIYRYKMQFRYGIYNNQHLCYHGFGCPQEMVAETAVSLYAPSLLKGSSGTGGCHVRGDTEVPLLIGSEVLNANKVREGVASVCTTT